MHVLHVLLQQLGQPLHGGLGLEAIRICAGEQGGMSVQSQPEGRPGSSATSAFNKGLSAALWWGTGSVGSNAAWWGTCGSVRQSTRAGTSSSPTSGLNSSSPLSMSSSPPSKHRLQQTRTEPSPPAPAPATTRTPTPPPPLGTGRTWSCLTSSGHHLHPLPHTTGMKERNQQERERREKDPKDRSSSSVH